MRNDNECEYVPATCSHCGETVSGITAGAPPSLLCEGCGERRRRHRLYREAVVASADIEAQRLLAEDLAAITSRVEAPPAERCSDCGAAMNALLGCSSCGARRRRLDAEREHRELLAPALASVPRMPIDGSPFTLRDLRFGSAALERVARDRRIAQRFVDAARTVHLGGIVTFQGPSGSGKTVLAAARFMAELDVALDRRARGYSSRFMTTFDLGHEGEVLALGRPAELADAAIRADLLVLDDLGFEGKYEPAQKGLRRVLGARFNEGRPTIVTTALDAEQLVARYGDGGLSRRLLEGARLDFAARPTLGVVR